MSTNSTQERSRDVHALRAPACASLLLVLFGLGALSSCSRLEAPDAASSTESESDGNGGGPFVGGVEVKHASVGLVSVVPAASRLAVQWRVEDVEKQTLEVALFVAPEGTAVFETTAIPVPSESGLHFIDGLDLNTRYVVGLGVRTLPEPPTEGTSDPFVASGPSMAVRTSTPVYADPLADANGADGLTPETAYPNLFLAVLKAFVLGAGEGGNVWVRGGSFEDASITVLSGIDMYGGFGAAFDLESRDPSADPTRLLGQASDSVDPR